jgi:hypothetical protein
MKTCIDCGKKISKYAMLRLAMTYKPFFDVSNGKALCVDCHEKYRIEARRDNQVAPKENISKNADNSEMSLPM